MEDYFDTEEFEEVLKEYEDARRLGMNIYMDADDLSDVAEYYISKGEKDHADEAIDLALHLHPQATGPLVLKARGYMTEGKLEEAERYCNMISPDDDDVEIVYLRAELALCWEEDDEAYRILEENIPDKDDDDYDDYVLDVMNIFTDFELFEDVETWYKRLHKESRESEYALSLLGQATMANQHFDLCKQAYEKLTMVAPFTAEYWIHLSACQGMLDKHAEALTSAQYALAINPNSAEAVFCCGAAFYMVGNIDEAMRLFNKFFSEEKSKLIMSEGHSLEEYRETIYQLIKEHNEA